MFQGQIGATSLLARLLAAIPDPHDDGIGVDEIAAAQSGVSSVVTMPTGDRYAVSVRWIGDRENEGEKPPGWPDKCHSCGAHWSQLGFDIAEGFNCRKCGACDADE